eukprot:187008-Amphidinium_carterae.1
MNATSYDCTTQKGQLSLSAVLASEQIGRIAGLAAMDFDELDEADDVILNNQPKTGTILPPLQRSTRVPGLKDLPWLIQKRLPPIQGQQKQRAPKLRLLCMMGAADNVCQEWCYMEQDAPEFVEMATQEPPGHGMRKDEPVSRK